MAFEDSWRPTIATGNSSNQYGPRDNGQTTGVVKTESQKTELKLNITHTDITAGGPALVPVIIPAGSIILEVYSTTTTAFTTGDAANVVDVGTDTSEAANGFTISAAALLNVGSESQTANLSGTWDAEVALEDDTVVGYAVSGITPATTAGEIEVTIIYI